jgi:hypothetical protein
MQSFTLGNVYPIIRLLELVILGFNISNAQKSTMIFLRKQ